MDRYVRERRPGAPRQSRAAARAAAGGDGVELFAAPTGIKPRIDRAGQHQASGLQLIAERPDEGAKLGGGIREVQLLHKPAGVPRERTVLAAGHAAQKGLGLTAVCREVGMQGPAHDGAGVIEQAQQSLTADGTGRCGIHKTTQKLSPGCAIEKRPGVGERFALTTLV